MAAIKKTPTAMQGLRDVISQEQNLPAEQTEEFKPEKKTSKTSKIDWRDRVKTQLKPLVEFQCILPGSGEIISYRSMSTRDLKSLLIYQNVQDPVALEEILDNLIESVVTTEGFSADNLYMHDKSFLIIQIRINSRGGSIESMFTCPKCKQPVVFNQDLQSMRVIPKPTDLSAEIVVSPTFSIYLDYNTRAEQKEAFTFATSRKDDERIAELGLLTLAALIKAIKIDGEMVTEEITMQDKLELFMSLPESIFDKIIEGDKKSVFGVDLKYDRQCPHCKHMDKIEIPMHAMFN